MGTSKFTAGDNPEMEYIPSRGEHKYSHLRHAMRTGDKCQPEKQLGLYMYADFFFTIFRYRALANTSLQAKQATLSK